MSILAYFPKGLTARKEQAELLLELERRWASGDVFVITAPTATGKTAIAVTIAAWRAGKHETTNYLPPTNLLVEQVTSQYKQLATMQRMSSYRCESKQQSCAATKDEEDYVCKGCPYAAALRTTRKAPMRAMNYHVYLAHKLYATNVIFDEAHQLLDMLYADVRLYRAQYKFPTGMKTVADVLIWGQAHQDRLKKQGQTPDIRLGDAMRQIALVRNSAMILYKPYKYRGRPDVMLQIIPSGVRSLPPWMWPESKVRKIVMMSSTINKLDIEEMGLQNKRVVYLECGSPIPPERRPVVFEPHYNMSRSTKERALPTLVTMINSLLAKHPKDRGLVHLPYALADEIRPLLSDPRLIFHEKDNKQWALEQFRADTTNRVLVASGLFEGVDLPYDAARWQLIGKVPYLSLADEWIKKKSEDNPDWYQWEAVKRVVQAAGRIVRAPDDEGISYIFDSQFGRLLDRDKHRHTTLFPRFFQDALIDLRR